VQESASIVTLPDGTKVDFSNWLKRKWFSLKGSGGVDALGVLTDGRTIAPGGYVIAATGSQDARIFGRVVRVDHHLKPQATWRFASKVSNPASRTYRWLA
jgi:hypothetical protein